MDPYLIVSLELKKARLMFFKKKVYNHLWIRKLLYRFFGVQNFIRNILTFDYSLKNRWDCNKRSTTEEN